MRIALFAMALISVFAQAACTDKSDFQWYDMTNQGRDETALKRDLKTCDQLSPILPVSAGSVAVQESFHRHDRCMADRGWELR